MSLWCNVSWREDYLRHTPIFTISCMSPLLPFIVTTLKVVFTKFSFFFKFGSVSLEKKIRKVTRQTKDRQSDRQTAVAQQVILKLTWHLWSRVALIQ